MPVSGEEPITSFFPRLTSSKRKEITSTTNRKRKQISPEPNTTKRKKVKHLVVPPDTVEQRKNTAQSSEHSLGDDLIVKDGQRIAEPSNHRSPQTVVSTLPDCQPSLQRLRNFPLRATPPRKDREANPSSTLGEDDGAVSRPSSTAHNKHASSGSGATHLIPTTHRFYHAAVEPSLHTAPPVKQPNQKRVPLPLTLASLPLPSVPQPMLAPLLKTSDVSGVIDKEGDMVSADDFPALPALSQTVVPSSQSLDDHFAYPSDVTLSPVPMTGQVTCHPMFTSTAPPIHCGQSSIGDVGDAESLGFVPSSQTQYMVPFNMSPRRIQLLRTSTLLEGDRQVIADEAVSSSQSQIEKELSVSMGLTRSSSRTALDIILANEKDDQGDHAGSVSAPLCCLRTDTILGKENKPRRPACVLRFLPHLGCLNGRIQRKKLRFLCKSQISLICSRRTQVKGLRLRVEQLQARPEM
jgi:hypothetical protein